MFLVFNSALKELDDTPQPKSTAAAVETNMGYCSIIHYLNLVVQFYLPI